MLLSSLLKLVKLAGVPRAAQVTVYIVLSLSIYNVLHLHCTSVHPWGLVLTLTTLHSSRAL